MKFFKKSPATSRRTETAKRKWAERRTRVVKLLGVYLDDLLMVSGGICLTTAASLRFGAAAGLTVCGIFLIVCSFLVACGGGR